MERYVHDAGAMKNPLADELKPIMYVFCPLALELASQSRRTSGVGCPFPSPRRWHHATVTLGRREGYDHHPGVGAGAEEATRDTNSDDCGGDHFHHFVAEGREQGENCELSDWRMAEFGSIRRAARRMEHRSG